MGKKKAMTPSQLPEEQQLLSPGEVALLFRVDPKTVTRWARDGRLSSIKTPGGHRRYRKTEVMRLLNVDSPAETTETTETTPASA